MRWQRASIALCTLLCGCSLRVASLTIVSPHPLAAESVRTAVSRGYHEGASCRFWLLGVPFGLPQVNEAIDNALRPVDGKFLRSATIYSEHSTYVLYGWHCYRARGEVFG